MPDSEPAVPANSSSPPPAIAGDPSALNYAFLVHSQKTLTQNLPPRVDNKLLARQKRRRTSPEDHAILEAEYRRNPKPDKAARASIVSRVALGEKEVQIWFQNRRQNDRRKSKPLQPHELVAPRATMHDSSHQSGSEGNALTEPALSSGAEQNDVHDPTEADKDVAENSCVDTSFNSSYVSGTTSGDNEGPEHHPASSQTSMASNVSEAVSTPGETVQKSASEDQQKSMLPQESNTESAKRKRPLSDVRGDGSNSEEASGMTFVPDLGEVKSPPSLRISLSFDGEAMVRREGELTPSPHKGRNAVRISLSSDGEALIRTGNEPSPSKSRMSIFPDRTPRFCGLRRSSSAVSLGSARSVTDRDSQNKVFGRSRDARTWELYCDTDARSALSTSFNSPNASMSRTPGLFRSQSHRSLTRSSSGKQNVLTPRSELLNRMPMARQSGEKRRRLSRAVSSLGRLESDSVSKPSEISQYQLKAFGGPKDEGEYIDLELGDSDKENWIPGTRTSGMRRRTIPGQSRRPILRDAGRRDGNADRDSSQITSSKRARTRGQSPNAHKENNNAPEELDEEVSAFMAGSGGPSQEEDLDCVQGLLSLSQGAWR
ncbi:hypothetical protein VTN02DRAFT_3124 [Thermoascus thermophilus]